MTLHVAYGTSILLSTLEKQKSKSCLSLDKKCKDIKTTSYIPVIFFGILLFRYRLFHSNLQNFVKIVVIEYLVQLTSRTIQIVLTFYSMENSLYFYYASLARCTCYFFVSLTLPAFVTERCAASYFLSDYEKKSRHWIFLIIITFNLSISVYLSNEYHQVKSTLVLHILMLIINGISSIMIYILEKYNYNRLEDSSNLRKSKRGYSLAERFQISENIRVFSLMKTIINVVAIFNLFQTGSAAMDNFDMSLTMLNICAIIFNICVLSYGSSVFFLLYYLSPPMKDELKAIMRKFRIINTVVPAEIVKSKPLNLVAIESDQYFTQLQKQWI
ncbi:unnamed protein product [Caenorhabditis angaria]|uniref:Uncharacterized protein n=1 Tax=Caenorhabditis angaria TaxID=860376 RepID=A0A9P1IB82_9PELO|nr:unnamed protein product [Caenorhabditis angaria]